MMSARTTTNPATTRSVLEAADANDRPGREPFDAARIVRGHVLLNEAVFDLRARSNAADSARALVAERQHEFVVAPRRTGHRAADAAASTVFSNLLSNAASATPIRADASR
jgi:hypothetical protein